MASLLDAASLEVLFGKTKRVLRNQSNLQDLIAAYPSLKEKCLSAPFTLSDLERRMLLDLPDEEMETANLESVTDILQSELIAKAVADPVSLTEKEAVLLRDHFWGPGPADEPMRILAMRPKPGAFDEFATNFMGAYLPNEKEAFSAGLKESVARPRRKGEEEARCC